MSFDFKNASKEELKIKYKEIAKEMKDDQFFTKKELNYLPEILYDKEQVLAFSSGLMDGSTWLIVLTDRRIIFLDKGMIYGLKQASIPLDKVNAIAGSTGILFGKLIITDGARERKIENVWKGTVKPFTNKAEWAIENAKRNQNSHPQSQAPTVDDKYAKISKLGELLDKGLISQDEFDLEKKKILGESI